MGTDDRPGTQQQGNDPGSMQQALQAALAKIQADVNSLSGFQQHDRKQEEQKAAVEEAKRAEKEESEQRAQKAHTSHASRDKPSHAQILVSKRHKKLVVDKPQDSSDDTDDEGSDRQPSEPSDSEQTSDGHSDLDFSGDEEALLRRSRALEEDDHGEEWHPESASVLQQLLRSINLEERTEMLEDLDCYYSRKQRQLQDEDKKLDGIEEELTDANTRLEKDSLDVKNTIDSREVGLYRVLRKYDRSLRELAAAPPELPPRLEEIKAGLLKAQAMDIHDLKAKSAEVLAVVANIQEYLETLEKAVEVEEARLEAYLHTERELTAAAETVSDTPLHDEVVVAVVKEVVRIRRQNSSGSSDSDSPVDEDVFEHCARLTRECEELRERIAHESERDKVVREGSGELAVIMRRKVRNRLMRSRTGLSGTRTTMLKKEKPPWESYALFSLAAQEQYEAELEHIRTACAHAEQLIRSFQEIQVLCANSVPSLEEGARKLTEVSEQAKKNIAVGSLPEEEDPEEALIRDLREANHEITLKQEAEHNSQMLKLEALEGRILQDMRAAEEKVRMLEWALTRENDKHDLMTKEVEVRKQEQLRAREKLENMKPLPFEEEQAEKARHLERIKKLQEQHEVAHDRMLIALRKAETTVKTFKQARSVGADLASKAAWKQLESGGEGYEAADAAITEWWQLVSDIQQEEQLEMADVDQMVAMLRQEESGAPVALGRDRTSIVEVQRPKLQEQNTSDRLAALMAMAEDAESTPVAAVEAPVAKEPVRKKQLQRRGTQNKLGRQSMANRQSVANNLGRQSMANNLGRQSVYGRQSVVRTRSRSRRLRNLARPSVIPKLMQARQRVRTKELLQEAQQDQEEAQELHERTQELCAAGAALEAKAAQFLRLRGKSDMLPAKLNVSFNLDEIDDDKADDPQVNKLRQELRSRQNEFAMLSGKMRDIRTMARRGGRSILKSGKDTEDLRREVLKLCNSALDDASESACSRPRVATPQLRRSDSPDPDDAPDADDELQEW